MLPLQTGVSLKPEHYDVVLDSNPEVGWFEVHAENYLCAGGPAHHYLTRIRSRYPLSIHGVGLSLGSFGPLDARHLQRLKSLIDRYEPQAFSEHLAWCTHGEKFFNDLLPVPYTEEALQRVVDHVDQTQEVLGRRILLENPSTYVRFNSSTIDEADFLSEIIRRTGCGLLLDVNNVFVSAVNHGYDSLGYIERLPLSHVEELHLAGHARECDDAGRALLIDTHDRAVAPVVWRLFRQTIERTGLVPTLIEWDARLPDWEILLEEAHAAANIMIDCHQRGPDAAHPGRI